MSNFTANRIDTLYCYVSRVGVIRVASTPADLVFERTYEDYLLGTWDLHEQVLRVTYHAYSVDNAATGRWLPDQLVFYGPFKLRASTVKDVGAFKQTDPAAKQLIKFMQNLINEPYVTKMIHR